jgi:hypothetical protein
MCSSRANARSRKRNQRRPTAKYQRRLLSLCRISCHSLCSPRPGVCHPLLLLSPLSALELDFMQRQYARDLVASERQRLCALLCNVDVEIVFIFDLRQPSFTRRSSKSSLVRLSSLESRSCCCGPSNPLLIAPGQLVVTLQAGPRSNGPTRKAL